MPDNISKTIKVMSESEIYFEEQEYNRAMDIMYKNVMEVTPEELQFVKDYGLIK
jgi:hypothetical protein